MGTVNVSRAARGTLEELVERDDDGWRNRLIWVDNAHVLASLADEVAGVTALLEPGRAQEMRRRCCSRELELVTIDGRREAPADLRRRVRRAGRAGCRS